MKGSSEMSEIRLLQIECDPYEQRIIYRIMKNGTWEEIKGRTSLKDKKYENGNLQSVIGSDDFFDTLFTAMATDNLMIDFIGTIEDFEELESATEYYNQSNISRKIKCRISSQKIYQSPTDILRRTEEIYIPLRGEMEASDEPGLQGALKGYDEASAKKIPLLMIGRYSTGKSTFVNALIGKELLPMAELAETPLVYHIDCDDTRKCELWYDKAHFSCTFGESSGSKPAGFPKELQLKLQTLLATSDPVEFEAVISECLQTLNVCCRNSHCAGKVSISLPCTSHFHGDRFHIIDLPGVDSDSFEEHRTIVEKELRSQAHGLPIYLTTSKDLDREQDTIKEIKKLSNKMDWTNMVIVLNMADSCNQEQLARTLKGPSAIKSLGNKILVVSSAMALGSKRQGVLNNTQLDEIFEDKRHRFSNPNDKYYYRLYALNHIPRSRIQKDQAVAAQYEMELPNSEMELIAWNSGIYSIERELNDYGNLLVDYLKSKEASACLARAVDILKKVLEQKERQEAEEEEKLVESFETKHKELCEKLENAKKMVVQDANQECTTQLSKELAQWKHYNIPRMKQELGQIEEETRSVKYFNRRDAVQKKLEYLFSSYLNEMVSNLSNVANSIWREYQTKYEDTSIEIIQKEDSLSDDEKSVFAGTIQSKSPNPPEITANNMITLFLKKIKRKVYKELESILDGAIKEDKTVETIRTGYKSAFDEWYDEIKKGLVNKAKEWNRELQELDRKRKNAEREKLKFAKLKETASSGMVELENMIRIKVVGLT